MSWTYDSTLATDRDKVRRLIGDVITAQQLLSNEEITAALAQESTVATAAALCCEWLAAQYARDVDVQIGSGSSNAEGQKKLSQKASQYRSMAKLLRSRGAALAVPTAATTHSSKEVLTGNEDWIKPDFERHMQRNPNSDVGDEDDPQ